MKITSTPPQRYRMRMDFEGDVGVAVDMDGSIRIKGFGEDRHYTVVLEQTDIDQIVSALRIRDRRIGHG